MRRAVGRQQLPLHRPHRHPSQGGGSTRLGYRVRLDIPPPVLPRMDCVRAGTCNSRWRGEKRQLAVVRRTCMLRALLPRSHALSSNIYTVFLHSGFSCSSVAFGQTCISTASEAVQTATCSGGNFVSVDFATFPIVDTSTNAESSSTATHSTLPIMAPMIQINWRSEDLMSATETVSTPSTPAGTGSGSSSSASISPGAVAGIVVAGVVSFFAITAFIFFWMRRRKARGNVNAGMTKDDMKLDQYGNPKGTELPSSHGRAELAAFRNPSELSGHQDPVELPTSPNNPPSYQN